MMRKVASFKTCHFFVRLLLRDNGGKVDEYILSLDKRSAELHKQFIAWGWEPLDDAYYKRLDESNREAAKILKETGGTIIIGD